MDDVHLHVGKVRGTMRTCFSAAHRQLRRDIIVGVDRAESAARIDEIIEEIVWTEDPAEATHRPPESVCLRQLALNPIMGQ